MYGNDRRDERSEFEKMLDVDTAARQHERDEAAWERLEEGQTVRTPDGWSGFVREKEPDRKHVYVETWDKAGTYRASRVEAR